MNAVKIKRSINVVGLSASFRVAPKVPSVFRVRVAKARDGNGNTDNAEEHCKKNPMLSVFMKAPGVSAFVVAGAGDSDGSLCPHATSRVADRS